MKRVLMLLFVITLILVGCAEGKPVNDNSNESKREDVSEISKTDNVSDVNESNDEEPQLICSDYRFSENGEVYNSWILSIYFAKKAKIIKYIATEMLQVIIMQYMIMMSIPQITAILISSDLYLNNTATFWCQNRVTV